MKLDDQWLASNPTKTPADLPDRLQALRAEEDAAAAHHAASITFDPSWLTSPPCLLRPLPDLRGAVGAGVLVGTALGNTT